MTIGASNAQSISDLLKDVSDAELYGFIGKRWHARLCSETQDFDRPKLDKAAQLLDVLFHCYREAAVFADPDLQSFNSFDMNFQFETKFDTRQAEVTVDSTAWSEEPGFSAGVTANTESVTWAESALTSWTAKFSNPEKHQGVALSLLTENEQDVFPLIMDAFSSEISAHRNGKPSGKMTRTELRNKVVENKHIKSSITILKERGLCRWCGNKIPTSRRNANYDSDECAYAGENLFKDMTRKMSEKYTVPANNETTLQEAIFRRLWNAFCERRNKQTS